MSPQHESCLAKDSANLDCLRSLAVMFVLANHLFVVFGYFHFGPLNVQELGYLGVLFFFVHTSCVLMCSLERQENRAPGRPLTASFFVRRVFRIYPLSIFIITVVFLFAIPVGRYRGGQFAAAHLDHFGLAMNYLLFQDIFKRESILVPLWSLPYEMHMYLLIPGLYWISKVRRGIWLLGACWLTSFVPAIHTYRLGLIGLGGFSQYVPCFIAGILAYKLSTKRHLSLPPILWPVSLLALAVVYLRFPNLRIGWICCAVLGFAIPQFREMSNHVWNRVFQLVARYSYGIYLTHLICLWLAFQRLNTLPAYLRWSVFVTTVTVSPIVLYHALESPMINLGTRLVAGRNREIGKARITPAPAVELTKEIPARLGDSPNQTSQALKSKAAAANSSKNQ
jgi:peptidoglycan/LPS O-acetylase OafA/YrhL